MKIKGKHECVLDLAFAVNISDHLNTLNRMLLGRDKVFTQYYDNIQAFKSKHALYEIQLSNDNPVYSPCLKDPCNDGSVEDLGQYKE